MNAAATIIPPGNVLLERLPAEIYHAHEALSSSGAKKILRSPSHFRVWRDKPSEPTPEMIFGSAAHAAILEPESFEQAVLRLPKLDRRTKEGKAMAEEFERQAAGRIVLDGDRYEACLRVRDAVAAHPGAQRLLAGTRKELSLFWTDGQYGVPCKARLDAFNGGITDVKTTTDASPDAFGRTIAAYEYHMQAAFYFIACEHVMSRTPDYFAFVAVEKEAPFAVACYVLEQAHLLAGARRVEEAIARYKQALEAGSWSGYGELIQPARLPAWALRFDN